MVDYAQLRGWLVYHPWTSIHSAAGWPDLAMVRDDRFIVAELKIGRARLTPAQQQWLEAMADACVPVYVWRPADWSHVMRLLS